MSFSTMKKIQSVTVSASTAATMEFTSIPGTFDDLVVKVSVRSSNNGDDALLIRFNGQTTNFSMRRLEGNGSTATSDSNTSSVRAGITNATYTASTFASWEAYIPNYASSNNKSVSLDAVAENNATATYQSLVAGLWSNTAAITSIQLVPLASGASLVQHSTATLYGIKRN